MRRTAFTLIELLVTLAIIALLLSLLLPGLARARASARDLKSRANLRALAGAHSSYTADNKGLLANYTESGVIGQQKAIIERWTGRTDLVGDSRRRPYVRFTHLVLIDYLRANLPEPMLVNPLDRQLLTWASDPITAEREKLLPYQGESVPRRYDNDPDWWRDGTVQSFAYGTSYQSTTAAWCADSDPTYAPDATNTNFYAPPRGRRADRRPRPIHHVQFPSQKVHLFEEYDFLTDSAGIFCLYDEAQTSTLQFDGSVRHVSTRDINAGWSPARPDELATQKYRPMDKFPAWHDGKPGRLLLPRHRFTREGLRGIDFGGSEINVPRSVSQHRLYPD